MKIESSKNFYATGLCLEHRVECESIQETKFYYVERTWNIARAIQEKCLPKWSLDPKRKCPKTVHLLNISTIKNPLYVMLFCVKVCLISKITTSRSRSRKTQQKIQTTYVIHTKNQAKNYLLEQSFIPFWKPNSLKTHFEIIILKRLLSSRISRKFPILKLNFWSSKISRQTYGFRRLA